MPAVKTWGNIGERRDLRIKQGGTFGPVRVTITQPGTNLPMDLTGCTFKGQIRKKASTADAVANFIVAVTDALGGKFEFYLPDEATLTIPAGETLDASQSMYVWDFQMTDSLGQVIPLFYGEVLVWRTVTRA